MIYQLICERSGYDTIECMQEITAHHDGQETSELREVRRNSIVITSSSKHMPVTKRLVTRGVEHKNNGPALGSLGILSDKVGRLDAVFGNEEQMKQFVREGGLHKVLSNWSYAAVVNDHRNFVDMLVKMASILEILCKFEDEELRNQVFDFYNNMFDEYLKTVYRCLSSAKPQLTNSILAVISHGLEMDYSVVSQFMDKFDLHLSSLPKLLVPSRMDLEKYGEQKDRRSGHANLIRYNFVEFWLRLLSRVSPFIRKDLMLAHTKIMNNLWKYMPDIDTVHMLLQICDFIDKYILDERVFKKATKCTILNENFIHRFQPIFRRLVAINDDKFKERFLSLIKKISTDFNRGLCYPNYTCWQYATESGVNVKANNKTFKINNKLIYTYLTTFKPWEHYLQLSVVVDILEANPELVTPYLNWIVQHSGGYHDPSLSSWWVGHTLLYKRILELTLPRIRSDAILDARIVIENIVLPPLSKLTLQKCVDSKHLLVVQLSLQLVIATLERLKKVLAMNLNVNRHKLINSVMMELPDFNYLVHRLNSMRQVSSERTNLNLVKLTVALTLVEYQQMCPVTSQNLGKIVNEEINYIFSDDNRQKLASGFNLALLECYLSIQSYQLENLELNWFNSTKSGNSFFSCLVKLAADPEVSDSFLHKVYVLLEKLTQGNLLFNENFVISPLVALLHLFRSIDTTTISKVWDLLDNTISRCVKSPYKYLDYSHMEFNDVSVFVLVLFDQIKYIIKKEDDNSFFIEWLLVFMKNLILIGENKRSVKLLVQKYLFADFWTQSYSEDRFLESLDFKILGEVQGDSPFLDILVNVSYEDLYKNLPLLEKKLPTSEFDATAVLMRLKFMMEDKSLTKVDPLVSLFVTKIGGFFLSSRDLDKSPLLNFMISNKFVQYLLPEAVDEGNIKNSFIPGMLFNEILSRLPRGVFQKPNALTDCLHEKFNTPETLNPTAQIFYSSYGWLLSESQVSTLLNSVNFNNEILVLELFRLVVSRSIKISAQDVIRFINLEVSYEYESKKKKLLRLLAVVGSIDYKKNDEIALVDTILSNSRYVSLLDDIILHSNSANRKFITEKLTSGVLDGSLKNIDFICLLGSTLSLTMDNIPLESSFFHEIYEPVIREIKNPNSQVSFQHLLNIFCLMIRSGKFPADEIVSHVFGYLSRGGIKKSFIEEFAELLYYYSEKSGRINDNIKSWLNSAVLYVTKKIAENEVLSQTFFNFLKKFRELIVSIDQHSESIWTLVVPNIINAGLEVILGHKKWSRDLNILRYVNSILLTTPTPKLVVFEKLLQIFVNNDANILNEIPSSDNSSHMMETALIVFRLYFCDAKKNSSLIFLQNIIIFYSGSRRIEDILLKTILQELENHLGDSWIKLISHFDLVDSTTSDDTSIVDGGKLITREKNDFLFVLNKAFVHNTINHSCVDSDDPSFLSNPDSINKRGREILFEIGSYVEGHSLLVSGDFRHTVYDPEFLLMLMISNEEWVKETKTEEKVELSVNFKLFLENNFLEVVIVLLSSKSELIKNICQALLYKLLQSLEGDLSFKDRNIFTAFISNILYTLKSQGNNLPHLVWYSYAAFVPILSNPSHFLYQRAYRFVLSSPTLVNDIPLYNPIIWSLPHNLGAEDDHHYYRELAWLLSVLIYGTNTKEDLVLLRVKGVFEWALNLLNLPYMSQNLRAAILKLFFVVQFIDLGSDTLVTRYAFLTYLEQVAPLLLEASITGRDKDKVFSQELKLNVDKIALRTFTCLGSNKRISDWSSGDLAKSVKRVHTA